MDDVGRSITTQVENNQYFLDAQKWYIERYVEPISYRARLTCVVAIIFCLITTLGMSIQSILPLVKSLQYAVFIQNGTVHESANVVKANIVPNNPLLSIAEIIIKNYVHAYEEYTYSSMEQRNSYIQNTSARLVSKNFTQTFSFDNPNSPVLRYQKDVKRHINVGTVNFVDDSHANVYFTSIAHDSSGNVIENMEWIASIVFEIDQINVKLPANSPFHFIVTDYQTRLVKNNLPKE